MIRHSVDDARRILFIALSGTVSGREFKVFASELYGRRAELFDYECIVDLLEYEGDVSYADLDWLQELYANRPQGEVCARPGVIVTLDPNFHLWAAALDGQFPGRTHFVAATLEAAFSYLEGLRALDSTRDPE